MDERVDATAICCQPFALAPVPSREIRGFDSLEKQKAILSKIGHLPAKGKKVL